MSRYEANAPRLEEGKAHSILERDERGFVIGAYTGYWNAKTRTVTLYPDYRHPALRGSVRLQKRKIYDGYVKCRGQNAGASATASARAAVKSQTSRAMKDIVGQEKMKF